MNYEEQIKLLSNEIYEKVINFINDNKDSDDILYEYAYLTLKNGMQIMFRFENGTMYITEPDVQGYNFIFPYTVKINKQDTEYKLKEQEKLTDTKKRKIKKYYEQLNILMNDLKYNNKKTRNADNYNYESFEVYSKYMYKKELKKLEQSQEKILPAVRIAVDWWANIICSEHREGSLGNNQDSKVLMAYSDLIYPKKLVTEAQKNKFKELLAKKIMDKIYESHDVIQMICDYSSDKLLYDAMIESGIDPCRTPYKTEMYIRAYYVAAKKGFAASDLTLFDSTEEVDLENVKNICCHNIKTKNRKLLSKKL